MILEEGDFYAIYGFFFDVRQILISEKSVARTHKYVYFTYILYTH